jgi:nucleotide-binding universal stress UspA family protein
MVPMNVYPYLPLSRVSVDPVLARRLPRRLAYYYLALPLAQDGDELTVVMAHPDNHAAVAVLQALLGAHIVPVQGAAAEIKAVLNRVWPEEADSAAPRIVCWAGSPERAAPVLAAAGWFAAALQAEAVCLDSSRSSLETALTVAHQGQYRLIVIDAPEGEDLSWLLREASMPLLLVRGERLDLRMILLVLRGHSSDESALDWVIPLAQSSRAVVTLLAVARPEPPDAPPGRRAEAGLTALLDLSSGPGEHIDACMRRLDEAGVSGHLKLRQGRSERQIALEAAQSDYDLITIAAEAHGDFVQQVLREVDDQSHRRPVLVIKPLAG